ncbi:MAG: SURF1 family protein [Pseudomonadota bacterium]
MRKIIFPLLLGIAGCAVLISLGTWQVQRLAWKEGILAEIDARMAQTPAPLDSSMTEAEDEYRRVTLSGTPTGEELHVLTSGTAAGTGYRVVAKVTLDDGTAILLDKGLLPLETKDAPPPADPVQVTGTLLWPDDKHNTTPDPDLPKNIWFARNVPDMAAHLNTAPFMVIASETTPPDPRVTPLPVNTANIKNDHLEYAITWFLLAAVWAIMSLYLIVRTRKEA